MSVQEADAGLERLLVFLRESRGFEFGAYKRPSLERRLRRRMEAIGVEDYRAYEDYLELNPHEFAELFNAVLINVSDFFRDAPTWEALTRDALPALLAARPADAEIRVWSAGCAAGQEAYTIAMLLAETLGSEALRDRVKVYATDLDERALDRARHAVYSEKEVAGVPEALRERYFERVGADYGVRKELRRAVIFGRNDLLKDAPISRLDLLLCRNTLMYFNAASQVRVLRQFHFALRPGGLLVLGKSETMLSQRERFEPVDLPRRVFRRISSVLEPEPSDPAHADATDGEPPRLRAGGERRADRDAALELGAPPVLVISTAGRVEYANLAARELLALGAIERGHPVAGLGVLEGATELLEVTAEAVRERRRLPAGRVTVAAADGTPRMFDLTVTPLPAEGGSAGAAVAFADVTRAVALEAELDANRRDLVVAYEELQSTIDELETTNEELQSSNEQLQTTNEELQSTNEELETINEELHVTNEELERDSGKIGERSEGLDRTNVSLEDSSSPSSSGSR